MAASKHTKVTEGRQRLISTYVLDRGEAAEYGLVDDDGDDLDEENESGFGESGVSTGVTEEGKNRWKRCSRL